LRVLRTMIDGSSLDAHLFGYGRNARWSITIGGLLYHVRMSTVDALACKGLIVKLEDRLWESGLLYYITDLGRKAFKEASE